MGFSPFSHSPSPPPPSSCEKKGKNKPTSLIKTYPELQSPYHHESTEKKHLFFNFFFLYSNVLSAATCLWKRHQGEIRLHADIRTGNPHAARRSDLRLSHNRGFSEQVRRESRTRNFLVFIPRFVFRQKMNVIERDGDPYLFVVGVLATFPNRSRNVNSVS